MRYAMMLVGLLVGCSSETTGSSSSGSTGCADISGNYTVTSTRASGTCDPKLDSTEPSSVTFSKAGDGTWNIVIPGLEGGCPGELNTSTCKFIATCKASKDGATVATYNVDYTFSGANVSGSTASALLPPLVAAGCTVTYSESGKKL